MEDSKQKVILGEFKLENTSDPTYPGTFPNDPENYVWSHENFKEHFKVDIIKMVHLQCGRERDWQWFMEFDLIGIDCAIANTLRRNLISEVPSMAIEKVFVHNNTSLIKDEVLAHRLGLVPLKADPRIFEYRLDDSASDQDTLEFELKVKCSIKKDRKKNSDELYNHRCVYSKDIKWIPIGNQKEYFKAKKVQPYFQEILLDKLNPGQELDLKLHAVKGIGRDHAKFSPVATAYYRMLPDIKLLREVKGEAAERLKKCFSPGVINIKEVDGEKIATVNSPRYDTGSREIFRHEDLKDCVQMSRIRNHFIFNIESVGALPPEILFLEAVRVMEYKCQKYLNVLKNNMLTAVSNY